ncbi:MAG: phospholipase D-like domain-containing protein [Myxococcota bacterium]|nr:phospholipase D-like domain-containing protein [Myxococcota bacterium]
MKISEHFARRGRRKGRPAEHEMKAFTELPGAGPEGLSFALYQSLGIDLQPGNRLDVLQNSRVFDALEQAIRAAETSVHILIYIWRPCDQPSERIVQAVLDRARAGVRCRVIVDPVGSESLTTDSDFDQSVEQRLRKGGVEVHYYRPLKGKLLGRLMGRTHEKIVVVDGTVGVTGGFGIWKAWLGDGDTEEHWRDTSVRVEGPAVKEMQLAFSRAWQESGGGLLPEDAFPPLTARGPARAGFVSSSGRLGVTDAERLTRLVIAAAKRRLWICNAYFTPPSGILYQLEQKAAQGVDIRVVAPGPVHDVKSVRASQRSTYKRLLKAGLRIWEYQPSMLHSKTLLVDDWLAVIGSINLDPLSLNKLGEGSLVMSDPSVAAELEQSFHLDVSRSIEMKLPRAGFAGPYKRISRRLNVWAGMDR